MTAKWKRFCFTRVLILKVCRKYFALPEPATIFHVYYYTTFYIKLNKNYICIFSVYLRAITYFVFEETNTKYIFARQYKINLPELAFEVESPMQRIWNQYILYLPSLSLLKYIIND